MGHSAASTGVNWGYTSSFYTLHQREKRRENLYARERFISTLRFSRSLSREAAPHGSNSCNPPIPTLATSTLFSSWFLSESLSQFPSRMQSLSLPLCSSLEALTDAGGEQEGEGSYLRVSTEARGEQGTPAALGGGWAVGRSLSRGT